MSIYFDLNSKVNGFDIGSIIKEIPSDMYKIPEYTFPGASCYFCHLCEFNPWEIVKDRIKETGMYGKCTMNMHVFNNNTNNLKEEIILDGKFFDHFQVLKSIHLINCPTLSNESEINDKNLKSLKRLILDNNELNHFPAVFQKMKNLKTITIENNQINSFKSSKLFLNYPNLVSLSLKNLRISQDDFNNSKLMKLPKTLEKLEIDHMAFNFIPFDFSTCENTLKRFSFEGVPWVTLDEMGGSNGLFSFENLVSKYSFLMSSEELKKLFKDFDSDGNNVLSVKEINKLNAFIFKKYKRIQSDANFGGFPKCLFKLNNLTYLNLSFHAITKIPDEINELKKLNELIIDNCLLLEEISSKLCECPITNISLLNCGSLKTPPTEIVKRGKKAIMSYLKRLSSGSVECKQTKLMLVGLGEAG
jgi:leucine-rich repeat kinase 2